jgi:hypothetical protein
VVHDFYRGGNSCVFSLVAFSAFLVALAHICLYCTK